MSLENLLEKRVKEIEAEFAHLKEWEDRYRYIIGLGGESLLSFPRASELRKTRFTAASLRFG